MKLPSPSRILVTGGTGFTGTHLVRRLLSRGHDVVVLDKSRGLFFDELNQLGARIHLGSITDRKLVHELVEGVDLVYHLAAAFREVNVPRTSYWEVNVEGTRNVMLASRESGVSGVIYCSTQGVHGHVSVTPGNGNSPITPADYYQLTKYEGEIVAREYASDDFKVIILRPTAIYGPGDPGRWLMLFKLVAAGRFLMFGDGQAHYHPVYIDNLIDAFELAGSGGANSGEAYLIGDSHYYSLNDLVKSVAEAAGGSVNIRHLPFAPLWLAALVTELIFAPTRRDPPIFRRRVDWFRQNRAFDISKARKHLNYQPRVGLMDGLRRTASWYRQHGYL